MSSARKERDLSQQDVATQAAVRLDTLRQIEQGRHPHPSFFTILAILQALDAKLSDFMQELQ